MHNRGGIAIRGVARGPGSGRRHRRDALARVGPCVLPIGGFQFPSGRGENVEVEVVVEVESCGEGGGGVSIEEGVAGGCGGAVASGTHGRTVTSTVHDARHQRAAHTPTAGIAAARIGGSHGVIFTANKDGP